MASAPVTNEEPLFWPTIQVRLRLKTGSPLWIVFYSDTEITPLDSFININSEQPIGTNFWFLNSPTWIIELLIKTQKNYLISWLELTE